MEADEGKTGLLIKIQTNTTPRERHQKAVL